MDLYKEITDKIIRKLEEGVVPWKRPYSSANFPVNWHTGKMYRGINMLLLEEGEYATFNQIRKSGGKVKKGEKGSTVIFWKMIEVEDDETGEPKNIPMMRKYKVFEINTQVDGLKSKREIIKNDNLPIEEAKRIINQYFKRESLKFTRKRGVPCYIPSEDRLCMPHLEDFISSEEYYSTFFHEMIHSTAHENRLNREIFHKEFKFGDSDYSKEELIAEVGASILAAEVCIDNKTIDNSASYINSWLKALKEDKTLIVKAAQKAQKATDYILNKNKNGEAPLSNDRGAI